MYTPLIARSRLAVIVGVLVLALAGAPALAQEIPAAAQRDLAAWMRAAEVQRAGDGR